MGHGVEKQSGHGAEGPEQQDSGGVQALEAREPVGVGQRCAENAQLGVATNGGQVHVGEWPLCDGEGDEYRSACDELPRGGV